jgi:hypothetical protein
MAYVSITGLRLLSPWSAPRFWWHAILSMTQAKRAPGLLSVQARKVEGVHHTVSVWRSRSDMLTFMKSGRHAAAMRDFRSIATGSTCGFEAKDAPSWDEALEYWRTQTAAA